MYRKISCLVVVLAKRISQGLIEIVSCARVSFIRSMILQFSICCWHPIYRSTKCNLFSLTKSVLRCYQKNYSWFDKSVASIRQIKISVVRMSLLKKAFKWSLTGSVDWHISTHSLEFLIIIACCFPMKTS